MQTSSKEGKKVLLRVSNLKQYFPLKKKGLFVKANDGITLDIYEGETFGLVGESGCGKSTLGRTLLQLYRQTDGRTMYYGRTLDDLAPAYVKKTLQTLDKRREKWHELKKHLANVQNTTRCRTARRSTRSTTSWTRPSRTRTTRCWIWRTSLAASSA